MQSVSFYLLIFFFVFSLNGVRANNPDKYKLWLSRFERAVATNNSSELQKYFINETEALQIANLYRHLIPEIAVEEYIPLMANQIQQKSDSSYRVVRNKFLGKTQRVEWINFEEKIENSQSFVSITVSFKAAGRAQTHKLAGIMINDEFNILEIQ
jgi:hypothetical protein